MTRDSEQNIDPCIPKQNTDPCIPKENVDLQNWMYLVCLIINYYASIFTKCIDGQYVYIIFASTRTFIVVDADYTEINSISISNLLVLHVIG